MIKNYIDLINLTIENYNSDLLYKSITSLLLFLYVATTMQLDNIFSIVLFVIYAISVFLVLTEDYLKYKKNIEIIKLSKEIENTI